MFAKKRMPVVVLLLLSVMLSACGGGAATPDAAQSTSAPGAAQPTAQADAPATAPQTASGTTLTMWTWKVAHVTALKKMADEFKAKTGITVEISAFNPDEAYITKVKAAANTNGLPDVLSYWSGDRTSELAAAGLLMDLTDKMTPEWKKSFYPATIDASYVSQTLVDTAAKDPKSQLTGLKAGQLFSVPAVAGNACLIFANKNLLKAAGLDPEKVPTTWEDWVDMIKATKGKDPQSGGLVTGLENPGTGFWWLYRPMAYTYLGPEKFYARDTNKDFKWNSPESVHTLELYDMLSDLWMPGVLATNIDPADLAFAQGKAAWDVGGTYTLSFLEQQGMKASDLLIFPVPAPKGAALPNLTLAPLSLIEAMVTKDAKNQDAALQWVQFMTSKDGALAFATTSHDMPSVDIGQDKAVVGDQLASMFSLFKPDPKVFKTYDQSVEPPGQDVVTPASTTLNKLVSKEMKPKDVADAITKIYDDAWAAVK